jgi:hypothetical protein
MNPLARPWLALAAGALLVAVLAGCGSARFVRPIAVPAGERIYVSVFVDETARGEVGVPLAEALRIEIHRRDPSRLAITFDEGAVAVDGTVQRVKEAPAGAGRLRVVVHADVTLVDKAGGVVAELGTMEGGAEYSPSRDRGETELRRREAMRDAVRSLAREILRQVDLAGRDHQPADDEGSDDVAA